MRAKTVGIKLSLPADLLSGIDDVASSSGRTRHEEMLALLELGLANLHKVDREALVRYYKRVL